MNVQLAGRLLIALSLACLLSIPSAVTLIAQTTPAGLLLSNADRTVIETAIEDSTGAIWGMSPQSADGQLYRWKASRWVAVPGPGGHWIPYRLWPGPRGGVIAVWVSIRVLPMPPASQRSGGSIFTGRVPFSQRFLLMWRRGDKIRRIAEIGDFLKNILPTASGQVLITGNGPNIDLVEPDGKLQPVYTLDIEQFILHADSSFLASRPFFSFVRLDATQDGQGRTWLWCDAPAAGFNPSVLQGFLIYNGKNFTYHRGIQGLPNRRFSYLGPWDADHLVAAAVGDGLYLINTSALTARRLEDPEPYVFRVVQKIFRAGTDRYVLSSAGSGAFTTNPFHEFENDLWMLRNGHWKELIHGVDNVPNSRPSLRPWAKTKEGIWLGTIRRGLWFIPANGGKPKVINWRQQFPFDSPSFLFALPQDRLMVINAYPQQSMTLPLQLASLLSAPAHQSDIRLLRTHFLLQPDAQHHLWGFVDGQPPGLDEWDGKQWLSHPLPPNLDLAWIGSLDADSQGRIWLFPSCRSGPSAFFDPRQGRWHEFASYRRALEEQEGHPLRFQNPSQDPALPAFGPGGRIGFMGPCGAVYFFDGSSWRRFRRAEIINELGPNDGPPFFDQDGNLKMDINDETWEFAAGRNPVGPVPGGGWHRVAFDPGPVRREPWFGSRPSGIVPSGCEFRQNSSLSRDRQGRYWWTWQGNLYEGTAGSCKLVLAANEAQPFIDGRRLRRVLVGPQGNVFLETTVTQDRKGEYVFLPKPD